MKLAFKEWAIVVDALGRGDQIFILRKGGIHEGRGGFSVDQSEFLFFPTLFHQQRESVVAEAQKRFDEIASRFPPRDILRVEYWAQIVESKRIESFDLIHHLNGQHLWREDVLRDRFEWGKSQSIHAMAMRVHQLASPLEMPMSASYSGCKSWVELDNDLETSGSRPVLADAEFETKLATFRACLAQG